MRSNLRYLIAKCDSNFFSVSHLNACPEILIKKDWYYNTNILFVFHVLAQFYLKMFYLQVHRRSVTQLTVTAWAWTTCDCFPLLYRWEHLQFQTLLTATHLGSHTSQVVLWPVPVQTNLHSMSSAPRTACLWTSWEITSHWSSSFEKRDRLLLVDGLDSKMKTEPYSLCVSVLFSSQTTWTILGCLKIITHI